MLPLAQMARDPETQEAYGTGWLPPVPDLRDYTEEDPSVAKMVKKLGIPSSGAKTVKALPPNVDLRAWCSKIESQGGLGSCTAQAAIGIVEYFERRAFGKHIEGSRLFVYKNTRNLLGLTGDTGGVLRTTMGALVLCGVAPEKYWKYTDASPDFDRDPPAFIYSLADKYKTVRYFCHDPLGSSISPNVVLARVKLYLAHGIPSMFGFYGFPSFGHTDVKGGIPFPCPGENAIWGHAIDAVGYNDTKKIKNTKCKTQTTGALLIRNSWGTGWGDAGYGWLPYDYVTNGLASDFWSLLQMEWVDTGKFGIQA